MVRGADRTLDYLSGGIEKDRRYPAVDHTLWSTSQAMLNLGSFRPADAQFSFQKHLLDLPGKEDDAQPITLDFGSIHRHSRRATPPASPPPSLRLRSSKLLRQAARVSIDRRFSGAGPSGWDFKQVYFCGPNQSIQCAGDTANYLWMAASTQNNCIPASKQAVCPSSPPLAAETRRVTGNHFLLLPPSHKKSPMETTTPAVTSPAPRSGGQAQTNLENQPIPAGRSH